LRQVNRNQWREAALGITTFPAAVDAQVLLAQTASVSTDIAPLLERQTALIRAGAAGQDLIGVLRAMHLSLIRSGGVRHTAAFTAIGTLLGEKFPTGTPSVDRELARTLAFLDAPGALPKMVTYMTAAGTHRDDQIFMMYCLRVMKSGWEQPQRAEVVKWFLGAQEQKWRGGASFPGYMAAMWKEFITNLPADERKVAEEDMDAYTPPPVITSTGRPQQLGDNATRLSLQELREYMTLDPMAYTGRPERGAVVFEKALCASCHRHGDLGQEAGPDLTTVAQRFARADLLDAVLTPSKAISEQWAAVEIVLKNKKVIVGVIVSETADTLTVQQVGAPVITVPVKDVQARKVAATSPMPEGLLNSLTPGEISDLFAFLERAPGN
jgi:putative heme-binding domain-containing protein